MSSECGVHTNATGARSRPPARPWTYLEGIGTVDFVRRTWIFGLVLVGLAFPVGLAVYVASGSSLVSPALTARVPAGEIARPSVLPVTVDSKTGETPSERTATEETTTDETTTCELTTTEDDSGSGRGRGRGRSGDD
jgi:hypothetical protein